MANSKSNIYPIQLQGAELCLNRYDAEIKQYRGFNRNNSPFVGGCLSNVFTKEEQITGGNADNTYIDTNGNVFLVKEDGIYLNNDKIKDFPEGVRFYEVEQIEIRNYADILKVFNEDVYIYKKDNYIMAHCYGVDTVLGNWVQVGYWSPYYKFYYDIQKNGDNYIFVCKYIGGDEYRLEGLHGKLWFLVIKDDEVKIQQEKSLLYNKAAGNGYTEAFYFQSSIFCFDNGCIIAPNVRMRSGFSTYSGNYIYIDLDTYTLTNFSTFTVYDNKSVFSNDVADYYMTNDGRLYLSNIRSSVTFGSTTDVYYAGIIYIENGTLIFKPYCSISVNAGTFDYLIINGVNDCNYIFSGVYLFHTTSDSKYYTTKCGFISPNFLAYGEPKVDTGTYDYAGNFKILIYDNQIIGLSVVDDNTRYYFNGNTDPMSDRIAVSCGVLVTDWNSVDGSSLVLVSSNEIVYKNLSDNKFYRIKASSPKLMLKNNQIVTNANCIENSIRLTDRKFLSFANDWNDAYIIWDAVNKDLDLEAGAFWVASAINEYNLKDNASILLNPRQVKQITNSGGGVYPNKVQDFVPIHVGDNIPYGASINFYKSDSLSLDTNALYVCSRVINSVFHKTELDGLFYPTNTDGNVQYNPNMFSEFIQNFGTDVFIKNGNNTYQLMKQEQENIMSYFLGTLVEGLEKVFIIQGQYYGIVNDKIFSLQFQNGIITDTSFVVNIQGLQFVGNTPYEALFFSKTNRCLYSFTGANVLNQKQLVDKISEVRNYLYNPATQTVFLITDIGVLFYGLFGMFLLEYTNISNIFLLDNGIVMSDNSGNYRYIKYYLDEGDTDYTKENINVETSFYGMNNEVVTINDCLYFRIFSEEHEEGNLKVSATTISLSGRKTEETTFKIKASDWDKITHTIYLRYQPKTQRGLGVAFAIDSPFKIASLSVGSQPDAVLVDKVSKGAITAPSVTTNNNEW